MDLQLLLLWTGAVLGGKCLKQVNQLCFNIQNCKIEKKGYKIESSFINNDLNFHKLNFKHNIFYYQVFGKSISFHRVNSVFLTRI